jgi:hypothetical protein
MNKLWVVRVSYEFVVVADDRKAAKAAALENAEEALHNTDYEDIAVETRFGADARGWENPMCIPVNCPDDKSIQDYLEENA